MVQPKLIALGNENWKVIVCSIMTLTQNMTHNAIRFSMFNPLLCQLSDSQMPRCLYKKVSLSFTIIICISATTRKFINKMWIKVIGKKTREMGFRTKGSWYLIQLFNKILVSKDKRGEWKNWRMIKNCYFLSAW